jgi:hypothetical protein
MKFIFTAVVVGSLLIGCASTPNPSAVRSITYVPTPAGSIVSLPEASVVSQAEIGQSMVSTAKKAISPAIKVEKEVVHFGANNGHQFKLIIPSSVLSLHGTDSEGAFYKYQEKLELVVLSNGAKAKATGGVYVPKEKTKPTEIYWIANDSGLPLNQLHPGLEYKETQFEQWGKDSFKRELVYSGVSQNTISILYREFQNDIARPAFSQELKYDLSQGKIIGYKGARFEVLRADNLDIRYKVMKALD